MILPLQIEPTNLDAWFGVIVALQLFELGWMGRLETRLSRLEGYLKGKERPGR